MIYDDIQVTTHHACGDDNRPPSPCYQVPITKSSAPGYAKQHDVDHDQQYKSLVDITSDDNTTKNEYAIANTSGVFLLNERSTKDSIKLNSKPCPPPLSTKPYINQKKRKVSINEPSNNREDILKVLKSQETEATKKSFKVGCLYCLVLFTTAISLAALAVAIYSAVQMPMRYGCALSEDEVNCLMELLQNVSFCDCLKNAINQSSCLFFEYET